MTKFKKYIYIKWNIIKHCNQQSTKYSGKFVCIGNYFFPNKSKVTLNLQVAQWKWHAYDSGQMHKA